MSFPIFARYGLLKSFISFHDALIEKTEDFNEKKIFESLIVVTIHKYFHPHESSADFIHRFQEKLRAFSNRSIYSFNHPEYHEDEDPVEFLANNYSLDTIRIYGR